ncbi:nucleic acid-binding protein [Testicularia cyperi]|uniref:Nucleic acid-binding protein n=1 Tax=Testicularia cyperi TaxID=1882483 RepID=A0A317XQ00_9BASI|nr:nucleic acid-binding protein [Testicularia cyperi]
MSTQRARQLITAAYAQFSNDAAAIQQLQGDASIPLPELAEKLASLTSKSNQIFGADDKAKAKTNEWLQKIGQAGEVQLASAESLKSLNAELDNLTFLASNEPTVADLALFASVYPVVSKQEAKEQHANPSLVRYVSHLSNLPQVAAASSSAQLGFAAFEPVYEGMPAIQRATPEDLKKEKKANKEATKKAEADATVVKEGAEKKEQKKKEKKEKAPKEAKAGGGGGGGGKKGGAAAAAASESTGPIPSQIDLRVGKIVSVEKHPDADALYLEKVDFGEADGPRTILSGLVHFVPIEKMQNRMVIGVCNLKPVAMRGIKSYGMLLCATHKDGKDGGVEPVCPPEGSQPGDKVWVEGYEGREPEAVLNPKKKIFEAIQPNYITTEGKQCAWVGPLPDSADPEADKKPRLLRTEKGVLFSENFVGASLS